MFEDFTDRAKKSFQMAKDWAQNQGSEFIGTEHVLLGLLEEGGGVGAKYLARKDISLEQVRVAADKLKLTTTALPDRTGTIPYSPRTIRVIELAIEAAFDMGANVTATEHILVALIKENEGIAAEVLRNLGVGAEAIDEIREILGLPIARKKKSYRDQANELLLKHAKRLACKLLQEGRTEDASVVCDLAARVECAE